MCSIRIPFLSRSSDGAPLQRCIDRAAIETHTDVVLVARIMSHFLEAIADEVSKGRVVRLPGFGLFAPKPIPERHLRISGDPSPRCKPVFCAARGFRAQVAYGVHPDAVNSRCINRFERNHGRPAFQTGERVFTAQRALREQIEAQSGYAR